MLSDVINKLESTEYSNSIDFARYKIDWVCALLLRVGETLKDSLLRNLLEGNRFITESVLDVRTHYKATETFQYTHFSSCHPPGVRRGFIEGEALRLLRTNSTKATFEEKIKHFESRLIERGYLKYLVQRTLSEVTFENRKQALQQKPRTNKRILPFVTEYHPSVLIERQPLFRKISVGTSSNFIQKR